MKKFELYKLSNENYHFFCFINVVDDVGGFINEIKKEAKLKHEGSILIDLFMRNGFGFNRYIELKFSRNRVVSSIVNSREINLEIKNIVIKHLKDNKYLLQQSALSELTIEIMMSILRNENDV